MPRSRIVPRLPSFVVFVVLLGSVLGGMHYYAWARLVARPGWGEPWESLGARAFVAFALLTPCGFVLGRVSKTPLGRSLALVAYGWFGVLTMLLFGLIFFEPVRLVPLAGWGEPSRSRDLAMALVGLVVVGGVHGVASARGAVAVKRVRTELSRLCPSLAGFRVVQLSDVHIGPTLRREFMARVVETVNALEPDLVVITGDLVDGSVAALREHTAPLADLRAKHGVFAVTGNHEYYSGADAWIAELTRLGVRTLRNERVRIGGGERGSGGGDRSGSASSDGGDSGGDGGFDLAGVDDHTAFGPGHGPDLARALEGRDERRECVLLAHQPRQAKEAAARGVGLVLTGHTHGGQIFPFNLFVRLQQPFVAGRYRLGATQIYVSRGTGYWGPPLRVLAPPEITCHELFPRQAR